MNIFAVGSERALRHRAVAGLLALALAAGVATRFSRLELRSFWLDEAYTVAVVQAPPGEILAGRAGDAHTPPLYYVLLRGWIALGTSDAWLRGFSALASCLVLLLAATVPARRWPDRETRGWTLGLLAVSPFQVYFAQEARMYSLATALALAVVLLEDAAARGGRWPVHAGLVAVGALGLYCHYYLAFVVAGSAAWRAWRLWRRAVPGDRWAAWWAVHLGIGFAFAPWVGVVLRLAASGGQAFRSMPWAVPPYAVVRFLCGYGVMPHDTTLERQPLRAVLAAWPWLGMVAAAGLVALLGWRRLLRRGLAPCGGSLLAHAGTVVACTFVLPAIVSLATPLYAERYLGIVQPLALLLVVAGVRAAPRRLAPGGLAVVLALSVAGTALWVAGRGGKERWRDAAELLAAAARPGELVLVDPDYTRIALGRYLRRTDIAVVPVRRDRPLESPVCGGCQLRPGERVWVTLSHENQPVEAWQRAFAPCAALAERRDYQDGVGVTVLAFEARRR